MCNQDQTYSRGNYEKREILRKIYRVIKLSFALKKLHNFYQIFKFWQEKEGTNPLNPPLAMLTHPSAIFNLAKHVMPLVSRHNYEY